MRSLTLPATLLSALLLRHAPCAQEVKRTYAIRIDGVVMGYQIETETPVVADGKAAIRFEAKSLVKVDVLGAHLDQKAERRILRYFQKQGQVRIELKPE